VGGWIRQRTLQEVVRAFEEAEAAVAPIYDIAQIMEDAQYQALDSITTLDDPELGQVKMQNVLFRMSETPGSIRWTGRRLGEDNKSVYGELGVSNAELAELEREGVI